MRDANLPKPVRDAVLDLWSQTGRRHTVTIVGDSMLPVLRAGDRVIVEHLRTGFNLGDIVIFQQGDKLIAHRVLRIENHAGQMVLTTKGDAVWHSDLPVIAAAIRGRACAVQRGARVLSLDTPAARALGWWIVASARVSARFYAWGSRIKIKFLGRQPNRITRGLKNTIAACFNLPQRIQSAGWKNQD